MRCPYCSAEIPEPHPGGPVLQLTTPQCPKCGEELSGDSKSLEPGIYLFLSAFFSVVTIIGIGLVLFGKPNYPYAEIKILILMPFTAYFAKHYFDKFSLGKKNSQHPPPST